MNVRDLQKLQIIFISIVMAAEHLFLAQVIFYLLPSIRSELVLNDLETPIREAQLRPRNFNPHPYFPYDISASTLYGIQSSIDNSAYRDVDLVASDPGSAARNEPSNGIFSQGPVQFPPQDTNDIADPLDPPRPYVARVNSARNRNVGASREYENESTTQKQYAFSYTVRDSKSGDDFSHTQQQKNGAVHGTYKVQLPDGRIQVVKYTADSNGYRADVSYINGGSTDDVRVAGPTAQPEAFVNEPFRNSYFSQNQDSYEATRANFDSHVNFNHQQKQPQHQLAPTPPSSSIYVSTVQPFSRNNGIVEVDPPQSISGHYAQSSPVNTYIVSQKSTQLQNTYDYESDYDYDKNTIVQRSPAYPNAASSEPQALYFKMK